MKNKKQYKIFDKLGEYPTAKILWDNYKLKLFYNQYENHYFVCNGLETISANSLSELMYLVDFCYKKD